jgi:feruloyl-CoA synthase
LLPDAAAAAIIAQPGVHDALRDRIRRHNATAQGSSTCIAGALLLAEPPSIDANEITDKGYINHRVVLSRREALVELLYRGPAPPEIFTAATG